MEKETEIICGKLSKAIDYFCEYATLKELKEQFSWYKVNNIYDLKNIMYESYLGCYTNEELIERIEDLYK